MDKVESIESRITALEQRIETLTLEKERLIGLVSHDLRSPLNRLFALIQLLLLDKESLKDEQKDYLEKMHLVVADGLAMMRNLVDYRNLVYSTIDLLVEPVNITEFVKTTVKHFKQLAEKKGIHLTVECESALTISTDKQCVHRILDNIISNAIKFSSPGKSVHVRIAAAFLEKVKIEIQDEAQGFSAEELDNLFQKFQKLNARPTGGETSTGLGLFIAKSMAERIGGTISCKTEEKVGSVFTVLLPSIK